MRLEDAHDQAAGGKEDRREEHDAQQVCGHALQGRVKAGSDKLPHEPRGEHGGDDGCDAHDRQQDVEHGAGKLPRARPISLGQMSGKDWDERRGDRAPRDQGQQQIGQLECCIVGVERLARAKRAGNDRLSDQADGLTSNKATHDDQAGQGHALSAFYGNGRSHRRLLAQCRGGPI